MLIGRYIIFIKSKNTFKINLAKYLKLDLEGIDRKESIKMDEDLIVKLDIEAMYPSITYELQLD